MPFQPKINQLLIKIEYLYKRVLFKFKLHYKYCWWGKEDFIFFVMSEVTTLPKEFKKIESLDDPTLYEYLKHHPNINRMYVLTFVFLILYLIIIKQRSRKL